MRHNVTFLLLLSGFLLLCSGKASAQATKAADYFFYSKSGTYSYLSGGTVISELEDDDRMVEVSLGFTFRYCGTDYTKIYAGTNGFLSFEALLSPSDYAWPPTTDTYLEKIKKGVMPLWEDLTGVTGVASYVTTGTAPNRVFTIEFKDWGWDYGASDPVISFQVMLYEKTNVIQFIYKSEAADPSWDGTPGGFIGISGGSVSDMLSLSSSSASPTASATVFTHDIVDKPATNQIYEFSPLPQCSGMPTALKPKGPSAKVCPGTEFFLTENVTVRSLGNTYQWWSRPAGGGTFTAIPGATSDTLKTSITAGTDYQLVTTCTKSSLSSTSATRTVEVLTTPDIDTSGVTNFCSNQILELSTASDTTYTYQWIKVPDGAIAGTDTTKYRPTTSGRYTVRAATSSCTGVTSTDTINVTVRPAPTAVIAPAPTVTICSGENTTLNGSGTGDYQWYNSSGTISGATATTYVTNTPEDYILVITDPGNGCKDTSATTTVIGTAPPTVSISPADSTNVCTGLPATLTGSTTGTGLSYQWYNSAGLLAGETSATLVTPDAERYMLVVKAGSCTDTSETTIVHLWPLPTAVVSSIGSTEAICPSNSDLVLQSSEEPGYTYQWLFENSPLIGATGREYTATTPGNYIVRVRDANGCIQFSDTFKAIATPAGVPTVSPTGLEFCDGSNLALYASLNKYFIDYQWYKDGTQIPGATGTTYVSSTSGRYSVQISDSFKCKSMSANALVTVKPLPVKPVITMTGKNLSTTVYASYQWYRNGTPIAGANSRIYKLLYTGIYTVEVSNAEDCYIQSEEFNIEDLAVPADQLAQEIAIYPNPSKDIIHIDCSSPVQLQVKDIQGRVISEQKEATQADMSRWPDGMYFFTISDRNNNILKVEKVIKYSN